MLPGGVAGVARESYRGGMAHESVKVLSHALDQAGDVLDGVHADHFDLPTTCSDWSVRQLVGHLEATPRHFLAMARDEPVDWSETPDPGESGWSARFRSGADDLLHHWHTRGEAEGTQADWQTAELAVHTWDLARATGQTRRLDPEVAERGLAFMEKSLTDDLRGTAFGPRVDVPADAPAYERLAAFAGRDPRA